MKDLQVDVKDGDSTENLPGALVRWCKRSELTVFPILVFISIEKMKKCRILEWNKKNMNKWEENLNKWLEIGLNIETD